MILLPSIYCKPIIGVTLIYAAIRFIKDAAKPDYIIKPPLMPIVLILGAGLGFFSGLIGIGGGIFLSPLLIMLKWEKVKNVSGIAAAFILVNSIAGFFGFISTKTPQIPEGLIIWAVVAVFGGYVGSEYGSNRFSNSTIKRLLSLVLLIAGAKMIAAA